MMLRYSLNRGLDADRIEQAVQEVLNEGYRTPDIYQNAEGLIKVGTQEMGDLVVSRLQ